ncbi:MAG TPA: hypothetical protein VKS60_11130, partial [Stellaceae bacterium]|nr:hypothetical protein [Stellaceae bacterium]
GDQSGNVATFDNAGTWDITDNSGIVRGSSSANVIDNTGLLEKTGGTGASTLNLALANAGMVEVTSGTLELGGAVTGTGSFVIGAAGTLKVDGSMAGTQTVTFAAATGELVLNNPNGNHLAPTGAISGFGGNDAIDLPTFAFSAATTLVWHQTNAAQGTLTVTDGSKVAVLTLDGNYTGVSFAQANDGSGGTLITDPPAGKSSAGKASGAAGVTADAARASEAGAPSPFHMPVESVVAVFAARGFGEADQGSTWLGDGKAEAPGHAHPMPAMAFEIAAAGAGLHGSLL